MSNRERGAIVVIGATGLQGGAVARQLIRDGWRVRAVTRRPDGRRPAALAALGAEVVRGDMDDLRSLEPVFAGTDGVYGAQNTLVAGPEAEIRQGRNVGDAARGAGVRHLVYGSAGTGEKGTGIPSWESKLEIEERVRDWPTRRRSS